MKQTISFDEQRIKLNRERRKMMMDSMENFHSKNVKIQQMDDIIDDLLDSRFKETIERSIQHFNDYRNEYI